MLGGPPRAWPGQHVLGVDRAAPKLQPVAEAPPSARAGSMPCRADLHRIEDVDAVVQQVGNVLQHAPQVWYQIFAAVRERMYCTRAFCRGLTMLR